MGNEKYLIPNSARTPQERQERARAMGIASGKARRRKKAMKETLETLLSMTLKDEDATNIEEIQSVAALKGENITVQEAIMFALLQKGMKGDTKATRLVVEILGDDGIGTAAQTEAHNTLIDAIRMRKNED